MVEGTRGYSNYELAVQNGFEGTEEEWLNSLKGDNGQDGYTPVKGTDYFTEEDIQQIESNVLDKVNQFSVQVVQELPTENIDDHTIYFVLKTNTEQNDVYDEYIYINNDWEHIGTTAVDLSNYYNKEEVDNKVDNIQALPTGGTTGQVLTKQSDTDGDATWEDSGDTLPIGSIVDYEGDTVPEGYVEVEDFNNANTKLDISKVINFTPQNATNYENYGNCYYYKIGSKVHLHIGILCDNSTKSVIYTMPEGFRPYTTVNSMGRGEDLDKYGMMAIGTDGKIYCISSTKYFVADIEYDVIG